MDKSTFAFIGLLVVLLLGSVMYNETFRDISDNSGNLITLSLSDLMTLFGRAGTAAGTTAGTARPSESPLLHDIRRSIIGEVRGAVRDELLAAAPVGSVAAGAAYGDTDVLTDSCIDTMANQQGADFMRYIPGKNPADYIRKDSIPCYGCSLPN